MIVRPDAVLVHGSLRGADRDENEDDYAAYEPTDERKFSICGRLLVLADGMGGEAGGGEASRLAVRGFLAGWLEAFESVPPAGASVPPAAALRACLKAAFDKAAEAVARAGERGPAPQAMGTTLTAAVLRGDRLFGVHVGDSRCLLVGPDGYRWLTELHAHPENPHRLTRALGTGRRPAPQEFAAALPQDAAVCLLSDGFWRGLGPSFAAGLEQGFDAAALVGRWFEELSRRRTGDDATILLLQRRPKRDGPGRDLRIDPPSLVLDRSSIEPAFWRRTWPWWALAAGLLLLAYVFLGR